MPDDSSQQLIETFYAPDGTLSGVMRHQQIMQFTEDGQTDVTLSSEPDADLATTPMAALAGDHRYTLLNNEHFVQHTGPDNVGTLRKWGTSATSGSLFLPRFGFNLAVTTFTPPAGYPLSFNHYTVATRPVATSVSAGGELSGPRWGGMVGDAWQGTLTTFDPDGAEQNQQSLTRQYHGLRWEDSAPDDARLFAIEIELWAPTPIVSGTVTGVGRHAGWLLEIEGVNGPGERLELTEILDARNGQICGLRRWWHDGLLDHIEIIHLSHIPEENT